MLQAIKNRFSPRAFENRKIDNETIKTLFQAGAKTASAYNNQPWRFIVARRDREEDLFEKVLSGLVEFNQSWCKNVPLLCVCLAEKRFELNNTENAHARYDLGQSVANIAIQASEMGLQIHQMSGIVPEVLRKNLNIPYNLDVVTVFAAGYPGNIEQLSAELQKQEKERKPKKQLEELILNYKEL